MQFFKAKSVVKTADAVEGSWVYRNAPLAVRPYLKLARMDRPIGTWLLLWPCLWSTAMASGAAIGFSELWLMLLFAVGALAMRGAGCTYNDIVDKDFDASVARTKSRPIPAGEVSIKQAWGFLVFQSLIGFLVLVQLNMFAIWVGLASLLLVAIYPFMKRITYWPQAWLGLTFNWGALVAWASVTGEISLAAVVLYAGCLFWTLGYDTVYAHQDREDDALVGVKSTALALGENTRQFVALFYLIFLFGLVGAGILANVGIFYYIGIALAATHLGAQVLSVDIDDAEACLRIFRSNIHFGWIVFIATLADAITTWAG